MCPFACGTNIGHPTSCWKHDSKDGYTVIRQAVKAVNQMQQNIVLGVGGEKD